MVQQRGSTLLMTFMSLLALGSSLQATDAREGRNVLPELEALADAGKDVIRAAIKQELEKTPKKLLNFSRGCWQIEMSGKFRPEGFYANNNYLLNSCNQYDQIIYERHTADSNIDVRWGTDGWDQPLAECWATLRNRGVWGRSEFVAPTTPNTVKVVQAIFGEHSHGLPRHFPWIREIWIDCNLNEAISLPFTNPHRFRLGFFPFSLGRAISLGESYAVSPGFLGFYEDAIIDQYAPGFKLYGTFLGNRLDYEFYASIVRNQSNSIASTALEVYAQRYGRRHDPQRGFGVINYILAVQGRWRPFILEEEGCKLLINPYILYNSDPEQRVDPTVQKPGSDADVKLMTLGINFEAEWDCVELSLEFARNFGRQQVYGIDRNVVEIANVAGVMTLVNSQVYTAANSSGSKVVFDPKVDSTVTPPTVKQQTLIEDTPQAAMWNGDPIANTGPQVYNSSTRFRDPYSNKFKGFMAIGDAAVWVMDHQLRFAMMASLATGDNSPNAALDLPDDFAIDGDYTGFIPLQETYVGDKVKSFEALGSRVPRPQNVPAKQVFGQPAVNTNGFTNLVLLGFSAFYKPCNSCRKLTVHPNIIAYWQEYPTHKFDLCAEGGPARLDELARNYMGVELNTFFNCQFYECVKFYSGVSFFIPGGHYADIKGTPITAEQAKLLANWNPTGDTDVAVPLLGDNTTWAFNIGLEYNF